MASMAILLMPFLLGLALLGLFSLGVALALRMTRFQQHLTTPERIVGLGTCTWGCPTQAGGTSTVMWRLWVALGGLFGVGLGAALVLWLDLGAIGWVVAGCTLLGTAVGAAAASRAPFGGVPTMHRIRIDGSGLFVDHCEGFADAQPSVEQRPAVVVDLAVPWDDVQRVSAAEPFVTIEARSRTVVLGPMPKRWVNEIETEVLRRIAKTPPDAEASGGS
ncbi:MAG: hypothetical protein AAGA48_26220 [Myxococcota bacterium]